MYVCVCVYVCGLNQIQIFSNKIIKNIQKNKKKKRLWATVWRTNMKREAINI